MKLGKRITALALSACMLLGVAFVPTQAQEAGNGSGHRGDAYNNGITTAKTPVAKEETRLLWAKNLGNYIGPPMYANGSIYTYTQSEIYKLNRNSGEVEKSAKIDLDTTSSSWAQPFGSSYFPVTYGDGKIYIGLLGGKIQAFDANTLEEKWTYTDSFAEESRYVDVWSPITFKDGKIYVGYSYANAFVCISSEGKLQWRETKDGSFNWNGAAVVGDYVIYTNQNGEVISRNKETGDFSDKQTFNANSIKASSVTYDNEKIYFMTEKATLVVADFRLSDGKFDNLKQIDCSSYGSSSTSTPVVYKGIVYVGVGNWRGGNVIAVNPDESTVLWNISQPATPQCSILLSKAYEEEGSLYLYSTYNKEPGGINIIKVTENGSKAEGYELFDANGYSQYCMASVIADEQGTLYYKNDSGYVMAIAAKDIKDNARKAGDVEKKIVELPSEEEITLDAENAISEVRKAYNELTDDQKALVTAEKLQVLTKAEEKIQILKNDKEAAEAVVKQIDDLGEIDLTKEEQVKAARKAYDELTSEQKELVSEEKVQILEKAETKIQSLKDDKEAADAVIKQIDDLGEIDLTKEEQVKAAREAYDALTEAQKALVSEAQLQTLKNAEAKISELKEAEANQKAAAAVISQIEALGKVDLTKENQVKEVRAAYDKLTDDQKKLVTNLSVLEKAEKTVKDLKAAQSSSTEGKTDTKPGAASTEGKTNTTKANPVIKAGMTVKTDSGKEYVKILSTTKKRVAYVKSTKKSAKNITVSSTVKVSGETYKVVAVCSGAFKKMPKLQKVTIGNNVGEIGAKAFYKSKKLNKIVITSKKLTSKKVSTKAFSGTNKKVTVKVPKKKYKAYKKFILKRGNKTIRLKKF